MTTSHKQPHETSNGNKLKKTFIPTNKANAVTLLKTLHQRYLGGHKSGDHLETKFVREHSYIIH